MKPPQHRPATSAWCRPGQHLPPNRRRPSAARAEPASAPEPEATSLRRRGTALRDVYGSRTHGVEDLALLVAQALDVAFVFRDSYELGEHYDYDGPGGERIEIKENVEDDDGELMEPQYPQYRSFVYVTQSRRARDVALRLARTDDVELVRCELVDP
jgi:hypothetical protein